MTDTPTTTELDLRAELARIDRDRAETQKLQEESRKYSAGTRRLDREYRWFPWLQLGLTSVAALAAIAAALVAHWRG